MSILTSPGDSLQSAIDQALPHLRELDDARAAQPRAPGKWSPKEVIGHLIDSASNNHQRFVRAQFQEDMIFLGYDQDAWVTVQRYGQASWTDLVDLWYGFNNHLVRVMAAVPEDQRMRERHPHNLHELAWETVPEDQPVTLDYFMHDYVGHLKHHLNQILPGVC